MSRRIHPVTKLQKDSSFSSSSSFALQRVKPMCSCQQSKTFRLAPLSVMASLPLMGLNAAPSSSYSSSSSISISSSSTATSKPPRLSVLIVGATDRTGLAVAANIHRLRRADMVVHGFGRDVESTLTESQRQVYHSVVEGDPRDPDDLDHALRHTHASCLVVCLGGHTHNNNASSNSTDECHATAHYKNATVCTDNAKALVQVLQENHRYRDVRVIVVSAVGAGSSEWRVKLRPRGGLLNSLVQQRLHQMLAIDDHTSQEVEFWCCSHQLRPSVTIVRPTLVTDPMFPGNRLRLRGVNHHNDNGGSMGEVCYFGDHERVPSFQLARADLARWIVLEAMTGIHRGHVVNMTGPRRPRM